MPSPGKARRAQCRPRRLCGSGEHSGIADGGIYTGVHRRIDDAGRYCVDPDSMAGILSVSDFVTAARPPLVSAVKADGTQAKACSVRVLLMLRHGRRRLSQAFQRWPAA